MGNKRVRELLVDAPGSFGSRTRQRRWERFGRCFPEVKDMRVLDLGGTVDAWRRAPVRPRHVTVLNLYEPGTGDEVWLQPVAGDACDPPDEVRDGVFDLIFSNSLLEHVGGHARRLELATVIRELAPCHWVQTPNRAFPVEPHFLFPGLQFLSIPMQARVIKHWPLVHSPPEDRHTALAMVQWVELVGELQMRDYFPDSSVVKERLAGLPKSLIAVRRDRW